MLYITGAKGGIMYSAAADIEVIDRYRLTWSFDANWVLEEAIPDCPSYQMSGDGFWEGTAVIEVSILDSLPEYEITSVSCDGFIQGSNDECTGWIKYSNSYLSDITELNVRILNTFEIYEKDSVKYLVDPFKLGGSAYPLNFSGLLHGELFISTGSETWNTVQEFTGIWGRLYNREETIYGSLGNPVTPPLYDVRVFSNDDRDIKSNDPYGDSFSKSLRLNVGSFDNIVGTDIDVPVYCDVEIKLVRIQNQ